LFSHVKQLAPVIASASEAIKKSWIASSLALLAMTQSYILAASNARVIANDVPPKIRGRRECRAPVAPVALRAKIKSTQASHHGHTGDTGLVASVACGDRHRLDTSVGVSGRHDFAVHNTRIRLLRLSRPSHLLPHVL
jgi:hypothetical protein